MRKLTFRFVGYVVCCGMFSPFAILELVYESRAAMSLTNGQESRYLSGVFGNASIN